MGSGFFDAILLDIRMSTETEGLDIFSEILRIDPDAVVVFFTAYGTTQRAVDALRSGAYDFIEKPAKFERIITTLHNAIKLKESRKELKQARWDLSRTIAHRIRQDIFSASALVEYVISYNPEDSINRLESALERLHQADIGIQEIMRSAELPIVSTGPANLEVALTMALTRTEKKRYGSKHKLDEMFIIHRNLAANLPLIVMDELLLANTLAIILENSVEAIEEKTGEITISAQKDGDYVKIEIKDNGIGISDEDMKKIFGAGYTTKNFSGMGLTICKSAIESHKGKISVQSQASQGTTVIIKLPVSSQEDGQ